MTLAIPGAVHGRGSVDLLQLAAFREGLQGLHVGADEGFPRIRSPSKGPVRVLLIESPPERVVPDIHADPVEVGLVADDVVVETPLP